MSKQDFIKWFKSYFVDIEFNEVDINKIGFMIDQLDASRPIKTRTRWKEKVVEKKMERIVYIDRLTGKRIGQRDVGEVYVNKEDLNKIAKEICDKYGVTQEQLKSVTRTRELVYCRKQFIELALTIYPYTSAELAKFLNRDHSSILHLKNKFKN